MAASLKTLFIVLTITMAAADAYTLLMDADASCFDVTAWWTEAMEADFFGCMFFLVAWFFYKESSWIKRVVFVFLMIWFGSCVPCGYIAFLLFKLSPEESLKDPIYFVLARRQNEDVIMRHTTRSFVIIAKVIVTAIGCYVLGFIVYAYTVAGFPFYVEVLTPCMITGLIDVSIHSVVFSVWIAYKESSWISAGFWIIFVLCFSGIGICVYVMRELFYLSPGEPISLILFNKRNRDMMSNDPLLMGHSDV